MVRQDSTGRASGDTATDTTSGSRLRWSSLPARTRHVLERLRPLRLVVTAGAVLLLLPTIARPSQTIAAASDGPAVSLASGQVQAGTLDVSGTAFGSYADSHPDQDKIAKMYDHFDRASITASPYGNWSYYKEEEHPLSLDSSAPRTGKPGDTYIRRRGSGLGFLSITAGNHAEYYSEMWVRFNNLAYTADNGQIKLTRLYSANSTVSLYPAHAPSPGWSANADNAEPFFNRWQSAIDGIPANPSGWNHLGIYLKKNSSPNSADGRFQVFWNRSLVWDWRQNFADPARGRNTIFGDADFDNADLAGDWAVGATYGFLTAAGTTVDWDDVYLAYSQQRLLLCPTSTVTGTCETQEISAKMYLGALPGSSPLYAFVIDAAGKTSNGVLVSAPSPTTGATVEFAPEADTYMYKVYPTTNYGAAPGFDVGGAPYDRVSYLRFNVAGLPNGAVINDAKLKLVAKDASAVTGGTIRKFTPTVPDWAETQPTWNNPLGGSDGSGDLATLGPVTVNNTYLFAGLTAAIPVNGRVTFVIRSAADDGVSYYSREYSGAAQRPVLQVTYSVPETIQISPEADTYMYKVYPTTNYGAAPGFDVGGPPYDRVSYLRFNVAGLPNGAVINDAKLKLVAKDASAVTGGTIRKFTPTVPDWAETQPTWNNPLGGSDGSGDLATLGPVTVNNTYLFAGLTAAIPVNGRVTFVIRSAADDGVSYYSREYSGAAQRPVLQVTYST
jgi:hypothetical protein